MLKITINDLLLGIVKNNNIYRLYFIRDNNIPIYIGQAKNVLLRLQQHLGINYATSDRVGNYIFSNYPTSLGWKIDFFTCDECELITRKYFPDTEIFDVNFHEQALIAEYKPKLNFQHNTKIDTILIDADNITSHGSNYTGSSPYQEQNNELSVAFLPPTHEASSRVSEVAKSASATSTNKEPTGPERRSRYKQRDILFHNKSINLEIGTLENVFSLYRASLSPHTIKSQIQCLSHFETYMKEIYFNNKPQNIYKFVANDPKTWSVVSKESIEGFFESFHSKGASTKSLVLYYQIIMRHCHLVYNAGIISQNQLNQIEKIRIIINNDNANKRKKRISSSGSFENTYFLSDKDAIILKTKHTTIIDMRNNLLLCLLLDQGLSPTEICNIKINQINFQEKSLTIQNETTTLSLKLTPDTMESINTLLSEISSFNETDFLVVPFLRNGKKGANQFFPNDFQFHLNNLGRKYGIQNLNVSICRSYWIKTKILSGTPINEIQERLGLSTVIPILQVTKFIKWNKIIKNDITESKLLDEN